MMVIDERRLDQARGIFLAVNRQHDGREFSQFIDHNWLYREEIRYKHRIWHRANDELDLDSWASLNSGGGEIGGRVVRAFRAAENLVPLRWGNRAYRGWAEPDAAPQAELEELTRLMMTAARNGDDVVLHFDRLCEFRRLHGLGCQWSSICYLLFLANKEVFFPVHSGEFQGLLEFLGVATPMRGHVSGENLAVLLDVADQVREYLIAWDYRPRDAIDVQSFMWVVSKNLDVRPAVPVAEADFGAELQRRLRESERMQVTGLKGEEYVYRHERDRLLGEGRKDLADLVELVSFRPSPPGYDVRSYEDGREIHIEVKTTSSLRPQGVKVFLTDAERCHSADERWRLCVVLIRNGTLGIIYRGGVADCEHLTWGESAWELLIAHQALELEP